MIKKNFGKITFSIFVSLLAFSSLFILIFLLEKTTWPLSAIFILQYLLPFTVALAIFSSVFCGLKKMLK